MKSSALSSAMMQGARWTGAAFILLMMVHVPLAGPFFCEDILAPLFFAFLVFMGPRTLLSQTSTRCLAVFLIFISLMSLLHAASGGLEDGYNACVLIYLAGVFIAFRQLSLPSSWRLWLGGGFLLTATLCWLAEPLRAFFPNLPGDSFWLLTDNARESAMSFLTKRYQFTFNNPNSLGSFYALPVALVVTALAEQFAHWGKWRRLAWLALLAVSMLPLCHTFSKHAILSGALILGFLCTQAPRHWKAILQKLSWLPVVLIGTACLITVLWATFPLTSEPPFINTVPGGYTIHQDTYARMALQSPKTFLTGRTLQKIRQDYPATVNRPRAKRILEQYNAEHLLDCFCSFMDPHNEYLNLLAFYGIGAVLLAIAFFCACPREAHCPQLLLLTVVALAFSCLWDDLLSKRWIWTAIACLLPPIPQKQDSHD